jgi:hypothetical protein
VIVNYQNGDGHAVILARSSSHDSVDNRTSRVGAPKRLQTAFPGQASPAIVAVQTDKRSCVPGGGARPGDGTNTTSTHGLLALRGRLLPQTVGKVPGALYAVTGGTAASYDENQSLESSLAIVFAFVLTFAPSRGNDDLSSGVSFSLVPQSVRDITQGVAPIDDRRDLAGFGELFQNAQVLSVVPHDEHPHPLAHKRR